MVVHAKKKSGNPTLLKFLKLTGIDILWVLSCLLIYLAFFHAKLMEILAMAYQVMETQLPADPSAVSLETATVLQQIAVDLGTLIVTYSLIIALLMVAARFCQTFVIAEVSVVRRIISALLYVAFGAIGVGLTYSIVFIADQSIVIPALAWNMIAALVTAAAFILSTWSYATVLLHKVHMSHCIIAGGVLGILWVLLPIFAVMAGYLLFSNGLLSASVAASKQKTAVAAG